MNIKALLFDLDGTLLDSLPLIRYSFQRAFEDMGLEWDEGRVMETVGLPLMNAARMFAGHRAEEFFRLYLDHQMVKHDEYIKLFPGTEDMLRRARDLGLKTGIVTSKRRFMAERAIELLSFGHLIDVMVALEDCSTHKPDPMPVKTALRLLDVLPAEAIFSGDSVYDVESGRGAGVITVGVTWGMSDRPALARCSPDLIVENWDDFMLFLEDKKRTLL